MGMFWDKRHRVNRAAQRRWVSALAVIFLAANSGGLALAEEAPLPDSPGAVAAQAQQNAAPTEAAASDAAAVAAAAQKEQLKGEQSKRIFGVIPTFALSR